MYSEKTNVIHIINNMLAFVNCICRCFDEGGNIRQLYLRNSNSTHFRKTRVENL